MPRITAYHRPTALADALQLLHRPAVRSVVLGGGTSVVPRRVDVATEVIDLQALGLSAVSLSGDRLVLGAMATLHDVQRSALVPAALREAARREQPSTLRTLSTVGGSVVSGGAESEFLATLLAFEAVVSLVNLDGVNERSLDDVLADPSVLHGAIVTKVTIDPSGVVSVARTGRTPMDVPIVSVVGRRRTDGSCIYAASGVASSAVVVADPSRVVPHGDFRGSVEYRTALAVELFGRVTEALAAMA